MGRVVRLNGHAFTVVGVAAPGFSGAKMLGFNPDLWVPLAWHRQILPGDDELLEKEPQTLVAHFNVPLPKWGEVTSSFN